MGSILAETTQAEKIEHLVSSVKDLFGAIFFVSVGILIDPSMLVTYAGPIALITVVTVAGKFFSITSGGLMAGQGLKTSIQSGLSVTQIGEFSFIIATLGLTLGVTSDFLYPIAVAVSAITTFTTPYMIRYSEPLYNRIEALLPDRWKHALGRYNTGAHTIGATSDWRLVLQAYIRNMIVYSIIIVAIVLFSVRFLQPFMEENLVNTESGRIMTLAFTLLFVSPFIWALAVYHPQPEAQGRLWANRNYRGLIIVLEFVRVIIGILILGFLLNQVFSVEVALGVGLLIIVMLVTFSKKIKAFYISIENNFLSNLNAREIAEFRRMHHDIAPWNAHLTSFKVSARSVVVGQTLENLKIREQYGVNIAVIERGGLTILPPTRDERIYPCDELYVFGTDEQIELFKAYLNHETGPPADTVGGKEEVRLQKFVVSAQSQLLNKTIRESGIREKTRGLIVGIERGGKRIMNPDSYMRFAEGDILWIVGTPWRIKELEKATAQVTQQELSI
jgi:CPA2 family monovalent cation:H+ antiporter-2